MKTNTGLIAGLVVSVLLAAVFAVLWYGAQEDNKLHNEKGELPHSATAGQLVTTLENIATTSRDPETTTGHPETATRYPETTKRYSGPAS
jgi:hypothetical protein